MKAKGHKGFSIKFTIEGLFLGLGIYYTWHHSILAAVATLAIFWLIRRN